jgi:hypothetical protein
MGSLESGWLTIQQADELITRKLEETERYEPWTKDAD